MMWQYPAVLILSTMLMFVVTGCASNRSTARTGAPPTSGPVAASPTTASLTGAWQGYVGVGARSTSVSLNLREEGQALKGNLEVGGRPDISGPVSGSVDGDTLRLRLESGAASPELRVKGDTMTGLISGEPLSVRRVR